MSLVLSDDSVEAVAKEAMLRCRCAMNCTLEEHKEDARAAITAYLQAEIEGGRARVSDVKARNSEKVVARRLILSLEPSK